MSISPRRCAPLWLGLALASCPARAWAQTTPHLRVSLEYGTDTTFRDCPSAAELSDSVAKQLGYDPFTDAGPEYRLRVRIERVLEHAEAHIEWIDSHKQSEGERRLHSESSGCEDIARSLAFAIAVQIQLHASATLPPEPASVTPSEPPPPAPPRAAVPPPRPPQATEKPSSSRQIFLGAGAIVRYGLTPGVSPGARVFGAVAGRLWWLELGAHATLPSELRQTDGTGFSARELGLSLAPCLRLTPAGLCAVGALAVLHAHGEGVDEIRSPSAVVGGVGARVQLLWPALQKFGLLAHAEVLALLTPRDVFVNENRVWSTAPVTVTASLDFAGIFR
jgi:hypothetical protein